MKRKREGNAMRKKPDEDAQFLKMFGLSLTASCFYAEGVLYSLQNERLSGVGGDRMRLKQKRGRAFQPDSIAAYFRLEWLPLTLITLSGLAYNVGLLAGPWFEGRLAQCLADIFGGPR